jgi:peptidoglycan/LPS O-acetylase OafA/YrhL
MLYISIPFLVYFFRRFRSTYVIFIIFFSSIFWVYFFTVLYEGSKGEELARQFPGQLSYFALGAYLAVNEKIKNNIRQLALVGLIAIFITNDFLIRLIIDPLAYSAIVLYLSLAACNSLNLGKCGDISFGIYLYHFPIIQLFKFMGTFEGNAWVGLLGSLLTTLVIAIASWHLIEKKFLKRSLSS